jgi:hypothetical protein
VDKIQDVARVKSVQFTVSAAASWVPSSIATSEYESSKAFIAVPGNNATELRLHFGYPYFSVNEKRRSSCVTIVTTG